MIKLELTAKRSDKMSYSIYLVEDDPNLNKLYSSYLVKEGYAVKSFTDGEKAKNEIITQPDLWIIDIMLPGLDGYGLVSEIKKLTSFVPIIFISSKNTDIDRIVGLQLGGDDYLCKPFLVQELLLRTKKLLARVYSPPQKTTIAISRYTVDSEERSVTSGGTKLNLTNKEFDLLMLFLENSGRIIERDSILKRIWGVTYYGSDRLVDDLVYRLRKKMPHLSLETNYGYGYRLIKN